MPMPGLQPASALPRPTGPARELPWTLDHEKDTGSFGTVQRDTGRRDTELRDAGLRDAELSYAEPLDIEAEESAPPDVARTAEPDADPEAVARAIVLRQLSAGPRTRQQLAVRLKDREVPADAAEAVLDRFEELRLIDDREFAAFWVRSRAEHRHLGAGALRRELRDKGVAEPLIAEALGQLDEDSERDAARHLVARKLAGVDRSGLDRKERDKYTRRLVAMLMRKGHSPGTAFSIVSEELSRNHDDEQDEP